MSASYPTNLEDHFPTPNDLATTSPDPPPRRRDKLEKIIRKTINSFKFPKAKKELAHLSAKVRKLVLRVVRGRKIETGFHQFSRLPTELRVRIWKIAIQTERVLGVGVATRVDRREVSDSDDSDEEDDDEQEEEHESNEEETDAPKKEKILIHLRGQNNPLLSTSHESRFECLASLIALEVTDRYRFPNQTCKVYFNPTSDVIWGLASMQPGWNTRNIFSLSFPTIENLDLFFHNQKKFLSIATSWDIWFTGPCYISYIDAKLELLRKLRVKEVVLMVGDEPSSRPQEITSSPPTRVPKHTIQIPRLTESEENHVFTITELSNIFYKKRYECLWDRWEHFRDFAGSTLRSEQELYENKVIEVMVANDNKTEKEIAEIFNEVSDYYTYYQRYLEWKVPEFRFLEVKKPEEVVENEQKNAGEYMLCI